MPYAFPVPPLTTSAAHALAVFFSASYVGSLYVSKSARLYFKHEATPEVSPNQLREKRPDERWRDDPDVIRARMFAASVSTVLSMFVLFGVVWSCIGIKRETFPIALESTIARLGFTLHFSKSSKAAMIVPCLIAPLLFSGPLYTSYLYRSLPFQTYWSVSRSLKPYIWTWIGWRNYIVGPITEELVFRGCTLAVYGMSGASPWKMIFLSPLTFGIAHAHHGWDVYNRLGRTNAALRHVAISIVFQLTYTSLFGFHCCYLFLRTGSIVPPMVSHIFCNVMGFPDISGPIAHFPRKRSMIIFSFLFGIAAYIYTIERWTRTEDSLYWVPEGIASRY